MSTPVATSTNLPPIEVPANAPLVPAWAREAIRRLNMITGASMGFSSDGGGYGSGVFAFSGSNARLMLPANGMTGTLVLPKVTSGGAAGYMRVQNGAVMEYLAPT